MIIVSMRSMSSSPRQLPVCTSISSRSILPGSPGDNSHRCGDRFVNLPPAEEFFIDQLIVYTFERIDKRHALQFETVLQIFCEQVPNACAPGRGP